MSRAFYCEACDDIADWRILRRGDAAVTWSCVADLSRVLQDFKRRGEVSEFVVTAATFDVLTQADEALSGKDGSSK